MTTDLHKEFRKKFTWTDFAGYISNKVLVFNPIKAKTRNEHREELWSWISQALTSEYKRGREEGINELMKKIRNKLVETKPMHDRRYEGNYEIEVFDGGFYWMKGRAEGILDEVLDTLKPKKK
jgi:hypothetical protein